MANRVDYFYRQKVTEAELDQGFDYLEQADRALVSDLGMIGIAAGGGVAQHAGTPDLTVDVAGSTTIYDKSGQRILISSLQNVSLATDESAVSTNVVTPGNTKVVSLFAKFTRTLSDPRVDGNSATVYFQRQEGFLFRVMQGAESAGTPTPVAPQTDSILLVDATRSYGQTQILNADLSVVRREDAYRLTSGTPYTIVAGTAKAAITNLLTYANGHVAGSSGRHAAAAIDYAGSPPWADTTALPASTVEAAIDNVVSALAGLDAPSLIGAGANGSLLSGGTIRSQLDQLDGRIAGFKRIVSVAFANDATADNTSSGTYQEAAHSQVAFSAQAGDTIVVLTHYMLSYAGGSIALGTSWIRKSTGAILASAAQGGGTATNMQMTQLVCHTVGAGDGTSFVATTAGEAGGGSGTATLENAYTLVVVLRP